MKGHIIKKIIRAAAILVLILLAISFLLMELWNTVLHRVMPVPALTYGQSLAMVVLARILFGKILPGYRKLFGGGDEYLVDDDGNGDDDRREAFREEWKRRSEQLNQQDE